MGRKLQVLTSTRFIPFYGITYYVLQTLIKLLLFRGRSSNGDMGIGSMLFPAFYCFFALISLGENLAWYKQVRPVMKNIDRSKRFIGICLVFHIICLALMFLNTALGSKNGRSGFVSPAVMNWILCAAAALFGLAFFSSQSKNDMAIKEFLDEHHDEFTDLEEE